MADVRLKIVPIIIGITSYIVGAIDIIFRKIHIGAVATTILIL